MSNLIITGKNKLFGSVEIEKSKNALLPIIAASVLASSPVCLTEVPEFTDISNMLNILSQMGATIHKNDKQVVIDSSTICTTIIPAQLAKTLRASIFLLGPLLAKFGSARASMPGGCNIGERPIDIHLQGFTDLGISVSKTDSIVCDASGFVGGTVHLRFASVGATENIIMCSVLAHLKTTTIKNCAKEPEIVDLCNFINKMGGKIYGAGTSTIVIVGVKKLNGVSYKAIPDRIVTGTYMLAAASCGGRVCLKNTIPQHNESLITILVNLGCEVTYDSDNIYISSNGVLGCGSCNISTGVYPMFATDMQSQTMALLGACNGVHTITENLFEARFNHVAELVKMGANISINGNTATIYGKTNCYNGAQVVSYDLRGGASLVIAGLMANGQTVIKNAELIYRGYFNLQQKLTLLGANIHKED